jgi:Tfp pilus assembly ATPase PilU
MVVNARIGDLIREARADEITNAIGDGDYFGMQTFEQALIAKVLDGSIEREAAADASSNRHDFLVALDRELKVQAAAIAPAASEPEPALEPVLVSGLRVA